VQDSWLIILQPFGPLSAHQLGILHPLCTGSVVCFLATAPLSS